MGENITSFFSGENIDFAYIITSMMNQNTPTYYLGRTDNREEVPIKLLSYSFMEGHKRVSYNFLSFSILLIFLSTIIAIVRKRKQT
ncbi:MAG: hypothetical protein HGN29_09240 [Asgard group archaeon]|nr:hypothetical protein [Asgard group archaeon]